MYKTIGETWVLNLHWQQMDGLNCLLLIDNFLLNVIFLQIPLLMVDQNVGGTHVYFEFMNSKNYYTLGLKLITTLAWFWEIYQKSHLQYGWDLESA